MEPSDPDVSVRTFPTARLAGVAAASAVLLTSTGDGLFAAVLLGLVAVDALAGTVAVLAVLGALARFGTTSLTGLAGAQAVLGPAVLVDPVAAAVASLLAAVAVLLVAPVSSVWSLAWWRGVPFGLLAGLLVLGPSASGVGDGLVRALGALVGVGLVYAGARWWPVRPGWARWAALGLSAVALALATVTT